MPPTQGYQNPYAAPTSPSASAPTAAAASPPPLPDYNSIIASSPYVVAANALAAQQLSALRAQLGSNAARALINLGDLGIASKVGDLNLPGGTGNLVDQANKAGTSVLSQLGYQHGLNVESIPAALAGRGFYRSGETGVELGRENKSYGNQQYQARQSTLDYLNGLYSNYLNAQFGIQQNTLAAQMQAYQTALANVGAYVAPPAPAPAAAAAAPPVWDPQIAPYGLDANGNPIDLGNIGVNPTTGQFTY